MSESDDRTHDDDRDAQKDAQKDPRSGASTDASELSDDGVGGTMTDEPNTMEPEEGLPEED